MTGTASTEAEEFMDIYGCPLEIPTNEAVNRIDENDEIYMTVKEKYDAIIKEITESTQINSQYWLVRPHRKMKKSPPCLKNWASSARIILRIKH